MTQSDGTGAVNGRPDADVTIIVDGANVVGSRPDGWWRDRAGAAVRLHDNLAQLAERGQPGIPAAELAASQPGATSGRAEQPEPDSDRLVPVTVLLVLEGAARAAVPRIAERARAAARAPVAGGARAGHGDGEVQVVSAPGSGDDEIVRQAQYRAGHCIVVTADRELRRRCQAAGARVASPSWLYGLL
jgi:rRNA-processing protein FCF1